MFSKIVYDELISNLISMQQVGPLQDLIHYESPHVL